MYSNEKVKTVLAGFLSGKSVKELSQEYDLSISTIYSWLKRYHYNDVKPLLDDITTFEKEGNFENALKCCAFNDNFFIKLKEALLQNQLFEKIKFLINNKKYTEGLEICNNDFVKNNLKIQSQKIKILTKLVRYEEALALCENPEYVTDWVIQSQRITILIKLKRYEEALVLCENPKYISDQRIQFQKSKILNKLKEFEESLCEPRQDVTNEIIQDKSANSFSSKVNTANYDEIYKLLSLIYFGSPKINVDMILESNMDMFSKIIVLFAYFDKVNRSGGFKYMKLYLKNVELDYAQSKVVAQCLERLKGKNAIFDIGFYNQILLGYSVILFEKIEDDSVLEISALNLKVEEKSEVREEIPKQVEEEVLKEISVEKTLKSNSVVVSPPKIKQKINKKEKVKKKEPTLREYFFEEVLEIEKYIYIQMQCLETQSKAIKAWDRLEKITSSLLSDELAYQKLMHIINLYFGKEYTMTPKLTKKI